MTPNEDIKNKVLSAIRSGDVKQRPHWFFVLRGTLVGIGVGLAFFAILYLISFILFITRETGVWFTPAFGFRGWFVFFRSLPWILIGLSIIFVVLLEIFVKRYSFAYREPLLYSVLGIVVIVAAGGFLLFETSLHQSLFDSARRGGLPVIGMFYQGFGVKQFNDIHPGVIIGTTTQGFTMQEPFEAEPATVVLVSDADVPPGVVFVPSDTVIVFGSEAGDVIQAVGVREVSNHPFPDHLPPPMLGAPVCQGAGC
jgi:hypothetical protein